VKTVADRYRYVAYYHNKVVTGFLILSSSMTLNDLEPPPLPKEFLVNFFLQFLAAAHISKVNCDEMPEDRPRQPAHEIFEH